MEHDSYAIIFQLYLPPPPMSSIPETSQPSPDAIGKEENYTIFSVFSDIKTPQKQGQGQKYISLGRVTRIATFFGRKNGENENQAQDNIYK